MSDSPPLPSSPSSPSSLSSTSSLSSSSSPPEGRGDNDPQSEQVTSAAEQLELALYRISRNDQDNSYLYGVNAELNGDLPPPPPDNSNGPSEKEARRLSLEMSVPKGEEELEEHVEKLTKSFEGMGSLAAELYAKDEEWREENEYPAEELMKDRPQQQETEKEGIGNNCSYHDIDEVVLFEDTALPEESDEKYNQLRSIQDKASMQLQRVLINLDKLAQENRYLRRANANLDGHPASPLLQDYDSNGVVETEAWKLIGVLVPNDENGLEKLIPKFEESFEGISEVATELFAKNEEWREKNDYLYAGWGVLFEPQRQQWEDEYQEKKRKEEGEGEEGGGGAKRIVATPEFAPRYEEDSNDDEDGCAYDSTLPEGPEETYKNLCITLPSELEETYKGLYSAQVRAFDELLANLDGHIRANQRLLNVNAELSADPSPVPPNYHSRLVFEAAEEVRQLLETKEEDEEGGLRKDLVQKLKKKFEEIGSLRAGVIGENEDLKEMNAYLREYGPQGFEQQEWQAGQKGEVFTPGLALHDYQDRNDDDNDLPEQNGVLFAKLLTMEAAMKDASKKKRGAVNLRNTLTPTPPSTKELKNVRAELVEANLEVDGLEKAATASSHHHLPCPIQPELESVRAALEKANARIGESEEKVAEELTPPSAKEVENPRAALVAASIRTPTPPPPKLRMKRGNSAALSAANEMIAELTKQLAGAIAKTTNPDDDRALSSPSPKPLDGDVEPSSPTTAPATTIHPVSEEAVDTAPKTPPQLATLSPAELSIKGAKLLSKIDELKQQVTAIESLKPYQHSASRPDDPPPPSPALTATQPLYFPPFASQRLPWLIWFFVPFMLVGAFLCWKEWAGLNQEREMWLAANEVTRVKVVS